MWLSNFTLVLPGEIVSHGSVRVEDGVIAEIRDAPVAGAAIALDVVVPGRHAGGAEKVLRRLRGPSPPQQIVILDVDARTAPSPEWATAFATETEWLAPVRRELESGAAGYFPVRVRSFSAPGYRVGVYRARR